MDATELALRALEHRDRSRRELDERLERAGIAADERSQALDHLAAAGLLSDERFAEQRAHALAARSASDQLIRGDLARHRIPDDVVERTLADLPPELERADRAFARRGRDAKALRYLAAKGFSAETLECLASSDRLH